jgi:hypothetical protein
MPRDHSKAVVEALNSWKEISAYMDRGVRTVQRWERELGLPIHRVGRGPRSPVHAFASELSVWLLRTDNGSNGHAGYPPAAEYADAKLRLNSGSAVSRVLVHRSSALVSELIQSITIQRQKTERLLKTFQEFRGQLNGRLKNHQKAVRTFRQEVNRAGEASAEEQADSRGREVVEPLDIRQQTEELVRDAARTEKRAHKMHSDVDVVHRQAEELHKDARELHLRAHGFVVDARQRRKRQTSKKKKKN